MLLSNYSDMSYIFNLSAEDFIELLHRTIEKEERKRREKEEEILLHKWGYELPFMEEIIQFREYVEIFRGEKIKERGKVEKDNEALINKIEKIKERHQRGE